MGRKSRQKKIRHQEATVTHVKEPAKGHKKKELPKRLRKYDVVAKVITYTAIGLVTILLFLSGFAVLAYNLTASTEATVGGISIRTDEVNKRFEAMKAQYEQYGIDPNDAQYASLFSGMRDKILEGMIENQLIYRYAKDNNLEVSKEELDKKVEEEFENTKKSFGTEDEFKKALEANNLTEEKLKEKLALDFKITLSVDKVLEEKYKDVKVIREDVVDYFNEINQVKAEHLLAKIEEKQDEKAIEATKKLAETILAELNEKKGNEGFVFATFAKEKEAEYKEKLKYEDLGFFGKGQMVKEFEEASYALKDGEISSEVIKTSFGFHIIHRISHNTRKVTFDTPEEREVQRILFSLKSDASKEEEDQKKSLAIEVLNKLKKGAKYDVLAKEYSEDTDTKEKGGSLGYIRKGVRGQVFDDFVFAAKIGEIVKEPLRTGEGFEILKVTAIKPLKEANLNDEETFKKVEDEVLQKRKDETKKAFLEELKKKYPVKIGNLWKNLTEFISGR